MPQTWPIFPLKECVLYGDPHVQTFDGMHASYYTPGEYWIVKSDSVKIQSRYVALPITNGLAVTQQIAVGGSFLGGNVLIVTPTETKWNGLPILGGFPSNFQNDLVRIEYNQQGTTLQKGRAGKALHVVHIHLPLGVEITVNRWLDTAEGMYVNLKVQMNPVPGMDGHCGNYNGIAADDARLQVRARFGIGDVPANELLLEGPKTPINPGDRPDLTLCTQDTLELGYRECQKISPNGMASRACLTDYCFAGGPALGNAV